MEKRNTGLDLYRIILMIMICIAHTFIYGGAYDGIVSKSAIEYFIMRFITAIVCIADDGYALLSGYYASNRKTNYKRIIKLWLIALFYSLLSTFIGILMSNNINYNISLLDIIKSFFPITFGRWYFTAYFFCFLLSPFVNKAIDYIDEKEAKTLLIIMFISFTTIPLFNDRWFNNGLSGAWLFALYSMGALIKKIELFKNTKTKKLFVYYVVLTVLVFVFAKVLNIEQLASMMSPLVLLTAIISLIMFSKLNIKSNKLISNISASTFGVYLFHSNPLVEKVIINNRFTFAASFPMFLDIVVFLLMCLLTFIVFSCFDLLREYLFRLIKIDQLLEKIYKKVEKE